MAKTAYGVGSSPLRDSTDERAIKGLFDALTRVREAVMERTRP